MSNMEFDNYQLSTRFYRLEFERLIAMRQLSLQQSPVEMSNISKVVVKKEIAWTDIVQAVESVIKATLEYSEEISAEAYKVSSYIKTVDTMESQMRIEQIAEIIESLECMVQRLVRYGWLIEREWNMCVLPPVQGVDMPKRSLKKSIFPSNYLRNLGTWHSGLSAAIAKARARASELSFGTTHIPERTINWMGMGIVYSHTPTQWSAGYVLEKAKLEKAKGKKPDSWLDGINLVSTHRPGQKTGMQTTDISYRNPLHYAAFNSADLLWLKRFNYLDRQELMSRPGTNRFPALGVTDLCGDTPLSIASRSGNVGAVKYILEESGVVCTIRMIVDAAVMASYKGHTECLALIAPRIMTHPESIAFVIRISAFYGFSQLLEIACESLLVVPVDICQQVKDSLSLSVKKNGGYSLFHLAALNNMPNVIRLLLQKKLSGSSAFDAHAYNDYGLTPLDVSNYFGFSECASVLLDSLKASRIAHPNLACKDILQKIQINPKLNRATCSLPDSYSIFVVLGTNDTRRFKEMPPISLDTTAMNTLFDENEIPRSTHLLLRIDSEQGMEANNENGWIIDVKSLTDNPSMPLLGHQPPAHFYTVYPERLVLKLELIPLVEKALLPQTSEQKVLAYAALTVSTSFISINSEADATKFAPVHSSGSGYLHAVFLSSTSGDIVGEANLEVVVAAPYSHKNFTSGSLLAKKQHAQLPWLSQGANTSDNNYRSSAELCSYNRSGNNQISTQGLSCKGNKNIGSDERCQIPQWRKKGETMIYGHRGSGMNMDPQSNNKHRLQLCENTVASMKYAAKNGASSVEFDVQLTKDMVPVIYHDWNVSETGFDIPVSLLTLQQFLSCALGDRQITRTRSLDGINPEFNALPSFHSNSSPTDGRRTVIMSSFTTLDEVFEKLPKNVGFDIELKYPMADEADEAGICTNFEMNLFVDRILDIVFSHMNKNDEIQRPIVFTSFHPDICLLLAHKINGSYPIMFLTDAGRTLMADRRCNSIYASVELCKWMHLAGIVTVASPITESPNIVGLVHKHNLALATYGSPNNKPQIIKLQQEYCVDIIITDDVRMACSALKMSDQCT